MVSTAKSQRARRRAEDARFTRALAHQRAVDPAWRARQAEAATQLRRPRRALQARKTAVELVADADRRTADATARLVELGEPVARVAARVGLPAAALRKMLRTHVRAAALDESSVAFGQHEGDDAAHVHEDV